MKKALHICRLTLLVACTLYLGGQMPDPPAMSGGGLIIVFALASLRGYGNKVINLLRKIYFVGYAAGLALWVPTYTLFIPLIAVALLFLERFTKQPSSQVADDETSKNLAEEESTPRHLD